MNREETNKRGQGLTKGDMEGANKQQQVSTLNIYRLNLITKGDYTN